MQIQVIVTHSGIFGWLADRLGLKWSHAALRCVDGEDVYIIEVSALGIQQVPWEGYAEGKRYRLFGVKAGLTSLQMTQVLSYAQGNIGKPYNYLWLVKIGWDLIFKHKASILFYRAHVCSSLVDDAFGYAGIDLVPWSESVVVLPDDLAASPLLEPLTPPM